MPEWYPARQAAERRLAGHRFDIQAPPTMCRGLSHVRWQSGADVGDVAVATRHIHPVVCQPESSMQIRQRKSTLSIIRSIYRPDRKRCQAVTLATIPATIEHVPDELWGQLRADEREQLARICRSNREARAVVQSEAAARDLPVLLLQVTSWYRKQHRSADLALLAEASRAAWTDVLAAMCTAGVGRTRTRRRSV
jgi:hypothetical protein